MASITGTTTPRRMGCGLSVTPAKAGGIDCGREMSESYGGGGGTIPRISGGVAIGPDGVRIEGIGEEGVLAASACSEMGRSPSSVVAGGGIDIGPITPVLCV